MFPLALLTITALASLVAAAPSPQAATCPGCIETFVGSDGVTYQTAEEVPTEGVSTQCSYEPQGSKQIEFNCFYNFDDFTLIAVESGALCPAATTVTMPCSFSK